MVYKPIIDNTVTSKTEINVIFTLSLILPIPANTEKLNPTKIVTTVNIAHQERSSPEKINFWPNNIEAISGHNAAINIANKNEKTEK